MFASRDMGTQSSLTVGLFHPSDGFFILTAICHQSNACEAPSHGPSQDEHRPTLRLVAKIPAPSRGALWRHHRVPFILPRYSMALVSHGIPAKLGHFIRKSWYTWNMWGLEDSQATKPDLATSVGVDHITEVLVQYDFWSTVCKTMNRSSIWFRNLVQHTDTERQSLSSRDFGSIIAPLRPAMSPSLVAHAIWSLGMHVRSRMSHWHHRSVRMPGKVPDGMLYATDGMQNGMADWISDRTLIESTCQTVCQLTPRWNVRSNVK